MNYYQEFYPLNPIEKMTDVKKVSENPSSCNCKKHHESNTVLLIIILVILLIKSFK